MKGYSRWILATSLILSAMVLHAEQSKPAASEWPRCYDEAEWTEFAGAIDAELVRTAEEAVKAAVTPILADKAAVTAERDEWKEEAEDRGFALEKLQARFVRRGLWIWGGVLSIPVVAGLAYAAGRLLPRTAP